MNFTTPLLHKERVPARRNRVRTKKGVLRNGPAIPGAKLQTKGGDVPIVRERLEPIEPRKKA